MLKYVDAVFGTSVKLNRSIVGVVDCISFRLINCVVVDAKATFNLPTRCIFVALRMKFNMPLFS